MTGLRSTFDISERGIARVFREVLYMEEKVRREKGCEPVSPELYTREYFTTDCDGYDLFLQGSRELPPRIREPLDMAGELRGKWVLDIGCGRGELVCEAARRGAHAVGIDYAEAALELARERLTAMEPELKERVEFLRADAKTLPFPDGSFDRVFMLDVYEHLHPHEIDSVLKEIHRVLRPGGRLIIHTGPNTWFYSLGYVIVRKLYRVLLRRELPENLRGQYDDIMHVNEQNPWSLFKGVRAGGYRVRVLPRSYLPEKRPSWWKGMAMRMLFTPPLGYIFCTSLLAVAIPRFGGREAYLRVGKVLQMMEPPRGCRVLLVGETEGLLAHRLAELTQTEVIWIEPKIDRLDAKGRAETRWEGFKRIHADPYRLPFANGSVDAIAAQFTLDYLDDPELALREWSRVLKSRGVLVLVARNRLFRAPDIRPVRKSLRSFSPEELVSLVDGTGLSVVEWTTLIPHLRLPLLYRGDLSFSYAFEKLPYFRKRGRLLFLKAVKR